MKKLFNLILLLLFISLGATAQKDFPNLEDCFEVPPPTFTGTPTLCEQFSGNDFSVKIGNGTQYLTSSDIGNSISGNVLIVGNFTIDAPFTFTDAIVQIMPDKAISVYKGNTLTITNSKLFACNGLWRGIRMNDLTEIKIRTSTIEDAEETINASERSYVTLDISTTTFNRNYDNIFIRNINHITHYPYFKFFDKNTFSCTSPLNSSPANTTATITRSGFYLYDCPVYLPLSVKNTFKDIEYGFYTRNECIVTANNLHFFNTKKSAIFQEKGLLFLTKSYFNNCSPTGIKIDNLKYVDLQNCSFNVDKAATSSYQIDVDELGVSSTFNTNQCNFDIDTEVQFRGINVKGTNVGVGSNITIKQIVFNAKLNSDANVKGIVISGEFPSQSKIDIYNNKFDYLAFIDKPAQGTAIWSNSTGNSVIEIRGNKENLSIYGNSVLTDYIHEEILYVSLGGVLLFNSSGKNNYISDNIFKSQNWLKKCAEGLLISNFKNTLFCSNLFERTSTAFYFFGQNEKTKLIANRNITSYYITIEKDSYIDEQIHNGNTWKCGLNGTGCCWIADPLIETDPSFADLSQFTVHTTQSDNTCPALFGGNINPYFPAQIEPEPSNIPWWITSNGTPKNTGSCLSQFTNDEDSKIYRLIANGEIKNIITSPVQLWQAEKTFYYRFNEKPSFIEKQSNL